MSDGNSNYYVLMDDEIFDEKNNSAQEESPRHRRRGNNNAVALFIILALLCFLTSVCLFFLHEQQQEEEESRTKIRMATSESFFHRNPSDFVAAVDDEQDLEVSMSESSSGPDNYQVDFARITEVPMFMPDGGGPLGPKEHIARASGTEKEQQKNYQPVVNSRSNKATATFSWEDLEDIRIRKKQDLEHTLQTHQFVFVAYRASWCTWSQRLGPIWYDLWKVMQESSYNNVALVHVDCAATASDDDICDNIYAFPTLRFYVDGTPVTPDYTKSRDVDSMAAYLKSQGASFSFADEMDPLLFQHLLVSINFEIKYSSSDDMSVDNDDEFNSGDTTTTTTTTTSAPPPQQEAKKLLLRKEKNTVLRREPEHDDGGASYPTASHPTASNYYNPELDDFPKLYPNDPEDDFLYPHDANDDDYEQDGSEDDKDDDDDIGQQRTTVINSTTGHSWEESNAVVIHTIQDLEHTLQMQKYVFVAFRAYWSGHCQLLGPIWRDLGMALKDESFENGKILLAQVECTVSSDVCRNQGIMEYPILRLFVDGMAVTPDYKRRPRTVEAFTAYLKEQQQVASSIGNYDSNVVVDEEEQSNHMTAFTTPTLVLDDDKFNDDNWGSWDSQGTLLRGPKEEANDEASQDDNEEDPPISYGFGQNRIGNDDDILPTYNIDFNDDMFATDDLFATGDDDGVNDLPTPTLTFEAYRYDDDDDFVHRTTRAQDVANNGRNMEEEENQPPPPAIDAQQHSWDASDAVVIHTVQDLERVVQMQEYVFVAFRASWCMWSQRLGPIWYDLGKGLEEVENVVLAHVDCATNEEVCRSERILAFPTLRLFVDGTAISPDYKMDRTVDAFAYYLRSQGAKFVYENEEKLERMAASTFRNVGSMSSSSDFGTDNDDDDAQEAPTLQELSSMLRFGNLNVVPRGQPDEAYEMQSRKDSEEDLIRYPEEEDEEEEATPDTWNVEANDETSQDDNEEDPPIRSMFDQDTSGEDDDIIMSTSFGIVEHSDSFGSDDDDDEPVMNEIASDSDSTLMLEAFHDDFVYDVALEQDVTNIGRNMEEKENQPPPAIDAQQHSWDASDAVIIHTVQDLERVVQMQKYVFVAFRASWCIWSQRLGPIWYELGKGLKEVENVVLAHVDCATNEDVCRSQRILAFPTLRLFVDGTAIRPDYKMDRTVDAFAYYLRSQGAQFVYENEDQLERMAALSPSTFRNVDSVSSSSDFGTDADDEEDVGAHTLHQQEKSMLRFGNLNVVPREPNEAYEMQSEEDSEEDLIRYVEEKEETPETVVRPIVQSAMNGTGVDSLFGGHVSTPLGTDDFLGGTLWSYNYAFVMFCTPFFCLEMEPVWQELGRALELLGINKHNSHYMLLGHVDCTSQSDLCQDENIEGDPSLRLYRDGQFLTHTDADVVDRTNVQALLKFLEGQTQSIRFRYDAFDGIHSWKVTSLHALSGALDAHKNVYVAFVRPLVEEVNHLAVRWDGLKTELESMNALVAHVNCDEQKELCRCAALGSFEQESLPLVVIYSRDTHDELETPLWLQRTYQPRTISTEDIQAQLSKCLGSFVGASAEW